MNDALNAVRYAKSSAFQDTKGLASRAAKRAFLRHLADMSNWSCAVGAILSGGQKPAACDHRDCGWMCFQSEVQTADELSMSVSGVKRTRRALVADGWVTIHQKHIGRGAVTFYELNRSKLATVSKRCISNGCRVPPLLRGSDTEKGGTVLPIEVSDHAEGEQAAPETGAACNEKGGRVPPLYRKNRNEPQENRSGAGAHVFSAANKLRTVRTLADEIEAIWDMWPVRGGKQKGLESIRSAIAHLAATGSDEPAAELASRVKTWLRWHARATDKAREDSSQFVPAIGFAQRWFGDREKRYLDEDATPQPEPRVLLNDGAVVPQSVLDAAGWEIMETIQ